MLCKSCGAQIADNSVFCTNCGVRIQPVSEVVQGSVTVPMQAPTVPVQESLAAEGAAPTQTTGEAVSAESMQESAAAESVTSTEGEVRAEAVQESAPADDQPQMDGVPNGQAPNVNGQVPYGEPQMDGVPNGQAPNVNGQVPYGEPQMNGVPNGQVPTVNGQVLYGQPQMNGVVNGQMPTANGQPQINGVPNGQMPTANGQTVYGQPQMNGMPNGQMPTANGQPQMNGVVNGQMPTANGQAAYGQPQMNGMPNGQMPTVNGQAPYGQTQMNGMPYGQAAPQPKKPFVMPVAVNVVGGILAIAAVAVFVCVLLLGKPEVKKSDRAVSALAVPPQQQAVEGGDELNVDLSGVNYQLEIPETDGYRTAQALAESYIFEDSDKSYLQESDFYALSDEELLFAYCEILAREGVDLSEVDVDAHEYFQRKNWYEPTISLSSILNEMDEEQQDRYMEMIENDEDPTYQVLIDAGILNETEVYNMKLIEEYLMYGVVSGDGPEDALDDMFDE